MAGHSKFKNIMHRKGAQDAKRAKLFTKLIREIGVAAKLGGGEAENNPRLRSALIAAREANLPKDRIQNAIAKATSSQDTDNYEEMRYEGYAPGGTAIIVEALTDNRNRTASEVRAAFSKHGGNLGETGSVSFMFTRMGVISFPAERGDADTFFEATIEAGGDDCIADDDVYEILCAPESLHQVREVLEKKFDQPKSAEIAWRPNNTQMVSVEEGEKLLKLLDALDDCDDVQKVIGNFEFPEELLKKLGDA